MGSTVSGSEPSPSDELNDNCKWTMQLMFDNNIIINMIFVIIATHLILLICGTVMVVILVVLFLVMLIMLTMKKIRKQRTVPVQPSQDSEPIYEEVASEVAVVNDKSAQCCDSTVVVLSQNECYQVLKKSSNCTVTIRELNMNPCYHTVLRAQPWHSMIMNIDQSVT